MVQAKRRHLAHPDNFACTFNPICTNEFETINLGWSIVYIEGSQVIISKQNCISFALKIGFVLSIRTNALCTLGSIHWYKWGQTIPTRRLTFCIRKTRKQVLWQTVKTQI